MISISSRTLSSAVDTNCDNSGGALAGDAITERGARGLALGDGGAISVICGDAGTASMGFGEAGTTERWWPELALLLGVTERKEEADAARRCTGAAVGGASAGGVDW